MKIKTAELEGAALDYAVAKCEGHILPPMDEYTPPWLATRRFSTDWALGGLIIERERIQLRSHVEIQGHWTASIFKANEKFPTLGNTVFEEGTNALEAAMRCFVVSRLGDEVELPDELINQ
jgi:hypothetical protein